MVAISAEFQLHEDLAQKPYVYTFALYSQYKVALCGQNALTKFSLIQERAFLDCLVFHFPAAAFSSDVDSDF